MITTNNNDIAEQIRILRNHGSNIRYHHDVIGYNSRLDELQAVVLLAKLKHISEYNQQRRRVAHHYSDLLKDIVTPPYEDGKGTHVYHQYTLLTDQRDAIMDKLNKAKIGCAIYYPIPLHKQKAFADIIRRLTIRYDNLFQTSFPYSSVIHQAPCDGQKHPEWHFHMSFYPPLLRSASVKKHMVGYELFANPHRDITAEKAAALLAALPDEHYSRIAL